jgi:hypothetical protein
MPDATVAKSAFAHDADVALSDVSAFEHPVIASALATTSAKNKLVCFFTLAPFRGVEIHCEYVPNRNQAKAMMSSCKGQAVAGWLRLG